MSQLMEMARDPNFNSENLSSLIAMANAERDRFAREAYVDAHAAFQAEVPVIIKRATVDFGGPGAAYSFAPLPDIVEQIKHKMRDHGLSFRWEIEDAERAMKVTCIITHRDGHSERTPMTANADDSGKKNSVQARASTVTYLQRYTLIAALGLTTADEDIDGRLPDTTDVPEQFAGRDGSVAVTKVKAAARDLAKAYVDCPDMEKWDSLTDEARVLKDCCERSDMRIWTDESAGVGPARSAAYFRCVKVSDAGEQVRDAILAETRSQYSWVEICGVVHRYAKKMGGQSYTPQALIMDEDASQVCLDVCFTEEAPKPSVGRTERQAKRQAKPADPPVDPNMAMIDDIEAAETEEALKIAERLLAVRVSSGDCTEDEAGQLQEMIDARRGQIS